MDVLTDIPAPAIRALGLAADPIAQPVLPEPVSTLWQDHASVVPTGVFNGSDRLLLTVRDAPRSHFELLRSWASRREDLPSTVASLALRGTGFRGNRNRGWAALEGNLHLSVMIRCELEASRIGAALSMLPVVATTDLLADLLPADRRPEIKWVNDVLIEGRKVAGLLAATSIRAGTVEAAIFGIGLNVATTPDIPPTPFVPATTSLADWMGGELPGLLPLALALVNNLERHLAELATAGPAGIAQDYRRQAGGLGREVIIWPDDADETEGFRPLAHGRLAEIQEDLTLRLEGCPTPVTKGRLAYGETLSPDPARD